MEVAMMIENGYMGLKNGILDQSAILLSRTAHLTFINCKDTSHHLVRLPAGRRVPACRILLAFSGLRKSIIATGYNTRVDECRAAAATMLRMLGRPAETPLLGNVTLEEYDSLKERLEVELDPVLLRRSRHFFEESRRVHEGREAWAAGDLSRFGALMSSSGMSSIVNYECGCDPLIQLREILLNSPRGGVLGARFSGAGFRGCCVALVLADEAFNVAEHVKREYSKIQPELSREAPVLILDTGDGARVL
ncbi:hypothetical protein CYMTET_31112 [Cymbomonas tetramitiformis]|uniref:GHMP kinase C-terminal domain-containing protein n=1 Tax=Cymbomonas tetramitiformis TaxID=36881 RepID=A0AAE0FHG8_9CHLO|nr:hypothetical protein CYMTET_31112 [Cymbomonas tetramitiformis]